MHGLRLFLNSAMYGISPWVTGLPPMIRLCMAGEAVAEAASARARETIEKRMVCVNGRRLENEKCVCGKVKKDDLFRAFTGIL